MKIDKIAKYKEELLNCFKSKSLIPVVGSGISCGAKARTGKVPSGGEFKQFMIDSIIESMSATEEEKKHIMSMPFSQVCELYEDDSNIVLNKSREYLKNNFQNVIINDYRKKFFEIEWPYVYTLNIDDAIEQNSQYKYVISSNREVNEEIYNENKCVIKLHGDIKEILTYSDSDCRIFSSKEYAVSLTKNASLLNKLKNDFMYQNILFIGCSLEDEIDLKTLSDIPVSANNAVTTRKYIFVKGMPSRLKQAQLKPYGITDVVYFDDYKEMFDVLYDIWNESQKISNSELDLYQNIPIISLRQNDEKNARYFYHCKNLNDLKKNTVTIPYFFIERKTREKILANIETHKIHIIYGTRVSGKSYLLIDLYKSIKDRKTMFFDGRLRINDNAFKQILATKNAVVIFDTGALSARQIDALLLSANNIHRNSTDIVLALNNSDNDVTGLIKLRIKEFSLDKNMIIDYDISNRLNSEENRQINDRLPYASLPPFKEHLSIIDNLIEAGNIMNISGKFEHIPIDSDISYKDLALLITLATKKKVYSLDIIKFGLEQEIGKAVSKYNPYIDIMPSNIIEKDSADMSSIKYIVNAHYWLCRALGEFATNKNNYDKIINAYKYIIERLKANAGSAQYKQYRACREFILFDTINKIFLNEKGGQMPLIVCLYREMHSFFANDAQFLHQNAKCYFRYSFYPKNQEKERYLNEALTMSKISAEMFENQYNERKNEKVLISQAHVHYTIASILSTICKQHKYQYIDEIRDAIEAIHIALCSPYNIDDFRNKHRSLSSTSIDSIIQDIYTADIQLDSDLNKKLSNIIQQMIARTDTVF